MVNIKVNFPGWQPELFERTRSPITLRERVNEGATFKDLLDKLILKYPALKSAVVDPASQQLYDHFVVIVNDKPLELSGGLLEPLRDGDVVQFVPILGGG